MEFGNRIFCVFVVCLGIALGGCDPSGQSAADDEKEPHFVLGQNRVNAMDYSGAVEAFEESLEANPHSAQAHYQLAMLYSEKENNPAAAIYHYQQYLRFDPKAPNADIVSQHITNCMQQLAVGIMAMPSAPAALKQAEQLTVSNQTLQAQLKQWQAYANQLAAAKTNTPAAQNNFQPRPAINSIPSEPAQNLSANPKPPTSKPRTHTVAAGETPAAIARNLNVNLNALLAANPGLDPKKLRIGQVINLPPQ